ncbi:alkaline phosphatase family protein [Sphingomonas turrisvirgatae]|uniref:Alkaline phosphatase n=1 Tax=Sphingomonas turrisvirgatae TaxID=1888892 RepID=A0A1E3M070_9SPHN|nr:alkaline phosphatase family protein [Sphingomonas turrisvirgatae]ODP38745.1 alkaline phosphatase [Sphingomonas turrisvirgatae]
MFRPFAAALALLATPALAREADRPPAPRVPPKLIVAIAVDQLSADVFAEYRQHFTGGLKRLQNGVVFPSGYQSHAATETCPGHSTILTGSRPARTGIIANDWVDLTTARADKTIYCSEDETVPGSSSSNYTVSPLHLKVPTLGERMKAAVPATRVVAVAGKDRAAVMMSGRGADQAWWWGGKGFVSYLGREMPAAVTRANAAVAAQIARPQPAMALPDFCHSRNVAVPVGTAGKTVGTGRFERAAGEAVKFRASPEFDAAIVTLATQMRADMKLGEGATTDLLIVGASASDYVGHTYGTEGTEMCLQLFALDRTLGKMFDDLDRTGIDYSVVLTADHGGHDLPERHRMHGITEAARVDAEFRAARIGEPIARKLGIAGQLLWGGSFGDMWVDPKVTGAKRKRALAEIERALTAHPQVQAVLTRAAILATPSPSGPPETWTLLQRARASYFDGRSGDFVVALKPRITPISDGSRGSTSTHGSFWDYDRRVPILFWRKGMTGFEQPMSVETVDILPTIAATIGLNVPPGEIDGRCLDLDAGPGSTCPAN